MGCDWLSAVVLWGVTGSMLQSCGVWLAVCCSPVGCGWLYAEGACSPVGCDWLYAAVLWGVAVCCSPVGCDWLAAEGACSSVGCDLLSDILAVCDVMNSASTRKK